MTPLKLARLMTMSLAVLILSACIPTSWSSERQAAAVDACQKARAISAPIPNPSAGAPRFSSDESDYILDALDYLVSEQSQFRIRRAPNRPFPSFSLTQPNWILPTEAVLIERRDAIRVAVIRSGNNKLQRAHEVGVAEFIEECRRQDLIA